VLPDGVEESAAAEAELSWEEPEDCPPPEPVAGASPAAPAEPDEPADEVPAPAGVSEPSGTDPGAAAASGAAVTRAARAAVVTADGRSRLDIVDPLAMRTRRLLTPGTAHTVVE